MLLFTKILFVIMIVVSIIAIIFICFPILLDLKAYKAWKTIYYDDNFKIISHMSHDKKYYPLEEYVRAEFPNSEYDVLVFKRVTDLEYISSVIRRLDNEVIFTSIYKIRGKHLTEKIMLKLNETC